MSATRDERADETEGDPAAGDPGAEVDENLWLEQVTDEAALDWVRDRNAETIADVATGDRFASLRDQAREVLDADDRIPYVRRRGEYLYNFWQDADHPRGLWRRTTLEEYRTPDPDWQVLLDVDALNTAEGENWVFKGASLMRPERDRALISLSRGGADASVVREFDMTTLAFIPDGFTVDEAKTTVGWIDRDQIFVGTDFGQGSLTSSGYPRLAKRWHRGTPLAEAQTVFEGKPDDVGIWAHRDHTPGWERDFIYRAITFFTSELYHLTGEERDGMPVLRRVEVPLDAIVGTHAEWLQIQLRSDWTVDGTTYPAGALLIARFDDFMAGDRTLEPLFLPDPNTALEDTSWTRGHLLLNTLVDVKSRIEVLTPPSDGGVRSWGREPLPGVPEMGHTEVIGTDPDDSEEYLLNTSGFTEPSRLLYGHVGQGSSEVLKSAPAFFDADRIEVAQHFATSEDGTKVPYFVVGPKRDEPGPTLLTAYGGFEISLTPSYGGVVGRAWLVRGGTYVVANLRGGGEYGPGWHDAALRENRPRAYEDLAAVARDLVARGITTADKLGVRGGSNGGLLTGVMLTRYPELFGAVISAVPLLDMRRYHVMLAGASWMAEYGDPDDPDDWAFLSRYSPYHNLRDDVTYPPVLFVTSTRDDRVHPGHARKMVARMRSLGRDVAYYENIEGGHGAAADNEQLAFREALSFEFLWRHL